MFRTALLTATAVATLPLASQAADRFETQVRAQMIVAALAGGANGFTLSDQMQVGSLRQGQSTSFTFTAREGVRYMLVANCDADCQDVDIALSEPDGSEAVADRDSTDQAIVQLPTGHSGTHRVTVSMANCKANPCRFGLGLFTK